MTLIWIVAAVIFGIFLLLFILRVIQRKRVLSDVADEAVEQVFNFREFLKMAYPAVLIYGVLYAIFTVLCYFEVFGVVEEDMNAAKWMPALLAVYVSIWLLLHVIDMDCRSRNAPFATFLKTVNTNTGVHAWNFVLLAVSVLVVILSLLMLAATSRYYLLGPLFLAVMVSVTINLFVGNDADWYVKAPSEVKWRPEDADTPDKVKIKAASQDGGEDGVKKPSNPNHKTPVERVFKWDMKEKWDVDTQPEDDVTITLFKEDWEDPQQDMRQKNPFFGQDADGHKNWIAAAQDLPGSASKVIQGPDTSDENSEAIALETIVNSAIDVAAKYNLAEYEVPDLLLSLCQSGINYLEDEKSKPINRFNETIDGEPHLEYFRFAAETLYDVEGDCDCKAVLACRLMKTLGVDAKLVSICKKGKTQPEHAALIIRDVYNRYPKLQNKKYSQYTYCEATGEGWKIGEVPEKYDENTIEVLA